MLKNQIVLTYINFSLYIYIMISWFKKEKSKHIGFEDVKEALKKNYILLNVLPNNMQTTLIKNTLAAESEEQTINTMINDYNVPDTPVLIYGTHSCDDKPQKKYDQLRGLGLGEIYIYNGGIFEWLLLNELYGDDEFPIDHISSDRVDILKYRPPISLFVT